MAGVIVGIVALPLAIAFGIASGVTPEKGFITAILGGFIVSLLGGSTVQIGGLQEAFIVVVYGIVQNYGTRRIGGSYFKAGVFLLLMGLFKLGSVIRFIPYPHCGGLYKRYCRYHISQIKDLLGCRLIKCRPILFQKWGTYFQHINTASVAPFIVGILSIAIIVLFPRITKKIPGSLVAIIFMTLVVYFYRRFTGDTSIETIGDRFVLSTTMPQPEKIPITMSAINQLLSSAFTIAMLGAIESLLSATVADGVTGSGTIQILNWSPKV